MRVISAAMRCLAAILVVCPFCLSAQKLAIVPPEIASSHFLVTIDGQTTPVMHAAMNDYFLNFAIHRRTTISVTADSDDFWAKGVEVQPWRLGIRPIRNGRTITFKLDGPAKISISRPGDYLGDAEMLYLFANAPEKHPPSQSQPGLRYYGPGVHRENIDAATGDSIYLAPGAVVFGALNVWDVQHVKVFGRGVIVYDGPQNPADDDGWMHKRNWHCITMDQASDISIEGITCVVRSRTWQIQMKDSHNIQFVNFKVIGANKGNANADGMDWLGGGDTVVRDSFFRAADDIFAMQGSWEGYGPVAFAVDGDPVTNITVENSVLSTSISNVVRAGWPQKNFEGGHFLMRNSDVLQMGMGGCGIPFALMEIWADPNGRGQSSDFHFENVRMEDWYSLVQLREPREGIRDVKFTDVAGLELPSLVPSVLKGSVQDVGFDNVMLAGTLAKQDADIPVEVQAGAEQPVFAAGGPAIKIVHTEGLLRPGKKVRFEVVMTSGGKAKGLHYAWTFGDGTHAKGRKVKHKFPDTEGTLWDGSGRFRVLVEATSASGRHGWAYAPMIISDTLMPPTTAAHDEAGLRYRYVEMDQPTLQGVSGGTPAGSTEGEEVIPSFDIASVRLRTENYGASFSGLLDVPADGGYSLTLLSNDEGSLAIDGKVIAVTPEAFAQVCGMAGNAVRPATGNVALAKGLHRIEVKETHTMGEDDFRVLWQGPGFGLDQIPASALSHDAVTR